MTSASVALLGRRNYEGFSSYWSAIAGNPDAEPRDRKFATWLNEVPKIVFSDSLTELS